MLVAALESGVFDRLATGPMPRSALLATLDLPPASADALCRALAAMGLIETRRGDRLALTIDGLVIASDPGIRAMIAHGRLLYADLADPLALLRSPGSGRIGALWPYAGSDGDAGAYSALMAASLSFIVEAVCAAHDFGRYRRVLDVGGGDGGFVAALADRWPKLELALADLPQVTAMARTALDWRGLTRVATHAVEASSPLPHGADAITLLRLLHDRDDPAALALLRRVANALPAGGTVVIAEPMARRGLDPQTVYFAAYFAAMGSGRLRTHDEIADLLRSTGLRPGKRLRSPAPTVSILIAQKHDVHIT